MVEPGGHIARALAENVLDEICAALGAPPAITAGREYLVGRLMDFARDVMRPAIRTERQVCDECLQYLRQCEARSTALQEELEALRREISR